MATLDNALIIIDMWDAYHPGHNRFQNVYEQTVNRVANVVKKWTGPVVLACYNTYWNAEYNDWEKPTHNPWSRPHILLEMAVNSKPLGLISWDKPEVIAHLVNNQVNELYYAGVSFPGCVQDRDLGINNMKYNSNVIIDCVIDLTSTGYNEHEIIHDTYRYALSHKQRIVTSDTL